jgi:hypothetical protein
MGTFTKQSLLSVVGTPTPERIVTLLLAAWFSAHSQPQQAALLEDVGSTASATLSVAEILRVEDDPLAHRLLAVVSPLGDWEAQVVRNSLRFFREHVERAGIPPSSYVAWSNRLLTHYLFHWLGPRAHFRSLMEDSRIAPLVDVDADAPKMCVRGIVHECSRQDLSHAWGVPIHVLVTRPPTGRAVLIEIDAALAPALPSILVCLRKKEIEVRKAKTYPVDEIVQMAPGRIPGWRIVDGRLVSSGAVVADHFTRLDTDQIIMAVREGVARHDSDAVRRYGLFALLATA